jgi:class 3 adenylate cyclase
MFKQKILNGLVVGCLVGVFGAIVAWWRPSVLEGLELVTYDMRVRAGANPQRADPRIVMVDVDDHDIRWVRRQRSMDVFDWPWPRELFGWTASHLLESGARAVVFDWIFVDPGNHGTDDVERFARSLSLKPRSVIGLQLSRFQRLEPRRGRWAARLGGFPGCGDAAARKLAHQLIWWQTRAFLVPDGKGCALWMGGDTSAEELGTTLERLGAVELFAERMKGITERRQLAEADLRHEVTAEGLAADVGALPVPADRVKRTPAPRYPFLDPPLTPLTLAARLGNVTQAADSDGIFRHYAPVARHGDRLYPSLGLAAALVAFPKRTLELDGRRVTFGRDRFTMDESGQVSMRFHGSGNAYSRIGIRHVLNVVVQKEHRAGYDKQRQVHEAALRIAVGNETSLPRSMRDGLAGLVKALDAAGCEASLGARLEPLRELVESGSTRPGPILAAAKSLLAPEPKVPTCREIVTTRVEKIRELARTYGQNPKTIQAAAKEAEALATPSTCRAEALAHLAKLSATAAAKDGTPPKLQAALDAWIRVTSAETCRPAVVDTLRSELAASDARHPKRLKRRGNLRPGQIEGRIFIIHAAAAALRDLKPTPLDPNHLGAEINANALDNILHGDFIIRTSRWAAALTAFLMCLLLGVGTFLIIGFVSSAGWVATLSALISVAVTGSYAVVCYSLYQSAGLWVDQATPTVFGLFAWIAALATNFYQEGKSRRFVQDALGRYTNKALVRELMANPKALSLDFGEKRDLTVFFSDLAGFTSISERLPPERLVHLLNDYLTEMTEIVLQEDGIVDKYIGDAIMAFWGAPHADPDHAIKACRATVRMQAKLKELQPKWVAEYGELVEMRVGINSGIAVAGNMGSKHKFNYTLMGDTVNLASRLEGANKPYHTFVMLGEGTRDRLGDQIVTRELDFLAVKGKDKPVRVYELMGLAGQVDERTATLARRSDAALDLYRQTKFEESLQAFQGIIAEFGEDGPSRLYIGRCREYLKSPPPLDWDGVYRMTTK